MNAEICIWVFGTVCGFITAAVVFSFRLGRIVANNETAMNSLNSSTIRLNELIANIQDDHSDHEKESAKQTSALWKAQDATRERLAVMENEIKNVRKDIELLASR